MRLDICFASDSNYFIYMATAMLSILKSAAPKDAIFFHILCNSISQASKTSLLELIKIRPSQIYFYDISIEEFKDFPAGGPHISNTAYYRYKMPEIFNNIDKVLYLDCDVIVKKSLTPIFEKDISSYYLSAVEDVGIALQHRLRPKQHQPFWCKYNSGVILINLKKWREDRIFQELMRYTTEHDVTMGDQEVINAVCKDAILPLPYEYNVQDSFFRWDTDVRTDPNAQTIKNASLDPAVIHYTYTLKPWNAFSVERFDDWANVYLELTKHNQEDTLRRRIIAFRHHQMIFPSQRIKKAVGKLVRLTRFPRWTIGKYIFPSKRSDYENRLRVYCGVANSPINKIT